jgi:hypothetical protein
MDQNYVYIIQEIHAGGSLFEKLKTIKKFTQDHALQIVKQLLGILNCYTYLKYSIKTITPFSIFFQSKEPNDLSLKIENPLLSKLLEESVKVDKVAADILVFAHD